MTVSLRGYKIIAKDFKFEPFTMVWVKQRETNSEDKSKEIEIIGDIDMNIVWEEGGKYKG